MPIPRLTSMPAFSSWAIRRAMMVCGFMSPSLIANEVIDHRGRRDDVVRGDDADRYDVVGAGDHVSPAIATTGL